MSDNPQAPLGKGMITAAWIVVLVMLTLLFGGFMDDSPDRGLQRTVQGEDGARVELQRNRSGHYMAKGSINGAAVTFFIDTGATIVSIPSHIADRLNLERGPAFQTQTANGSMTSYATRLDSVSLGPITQYDVLAAISPNSDMDEILLGMSFLKHLEFTQKGDVLVLRQ